MRLDEPTLKGRFVTLEPLGPEHADELLPAAAESDVWRFMTARADSREGVARWIAGRSEGRGVTTLPFLQRDARSGQAFGTTSLFDIDLPMKRAEIGYTWIGASHRRTAANTEAKLLLLAHAFDTLGLNRVQLKTDARNERSQRAIARLGAVREGVLRRHMVLPDGHVRDTVMFSIIREEWPAVRERLEGFLAR